jgi:hypothetical protein
MKPLKLLLALLFTTAVLSGCGSTGALNSANITEVQLADNNYEIVATNMKGKASAGYLLGISTGAGNRQIQTFAIARLNGSSSLFGDAVENLWENFRDQYGKVEGRELALVNIRYDTDALNLFVYTKPTVSVRADVVEFK